MTHPFKQKIHQGLEHLVDGVATLTVLTSLYAVGVAGPIYGLKAAAEAIENPAFV